MKIKDLNWLENKIKLDNLDIEYHKNQTIKEITSLDRKKMFHDRNNSRKELSLKEKILIIFGYGKKR